MSIFANINAMLKSSNRLHDFHQIQESLELPVNAILRQSLTRWLTLEECILRILQQWPALEEFCEVLLEGKKDANVQSVSDMLKKTETKCYFLLLKYVLGEMNALNRFYQTEKVIVHRIGEMVERTFKNIISCMMDRSYIADTPAQSIDILNEEKYLPFEFFECGEEFRELMLTDDPALEQMCTNSFNFIVRIAFEMKGRFHNFDNEVYKAVQCLRPQNALSEAYRLAKDTQEVFNNFLIVFKKLTADVGVADLKMQWDNLIYVDEVPEELCNDDKIQHF